MGRSEDLERSTVSNETFWTSYSDLFTGLTIIFLVMFFFATLRAGVVQLQSAMQKKQQEEYLKGQVPKEVADQTKAREALVRNTLQKIQEKREHINQLVQNLDSQSQVMEQVLHDQEQKAAQLSSSYEANRRLEREIGELQTFKDKLHADLREKDLAIQSLNDKIQEFDQAKLKWERQLGDLSENLRTKDYEIGKKQRDIEHLTQSLEEQAKAVESARLAVEAEQAKTQRLQGELRDHDNRLKRTLSELQSANQTIDGLKSDVQGRDTKINQLAGKVELANERIEGLQGELANREAELKRAGAQLAGVRTENDKLKAERAGREGTIERLKAETAKALREIAGLKDELAGRDGKIAGLNEKVNGLKREVLGRDGTIAKLKGKIDAAEGTIDGLNNELSGRDGEIAKLKGLLDGVKKQLAGREGDLDRARGELSAAKGKLASLQDKLGDHDGQIGKLKDELGGLERELAGRDGKLADLQEKLKAAGRELAGLKDELDRHRKNMADAKGNGVEKDRKIASLGDELKAAKREIDELSRVRREIAGGVLKNLRAGGIDVAVDPDSGMITLSMDEAFQFKNGSYEITDSTKAKIRKIMPLYTQSLLGTRDRAEKVASIVITGHASPRYRKKFVDPRSFDRKAYVFNLDLSMKRAQQIAGYIFSDEIGEYPHKQELRSKTSAAGKGFMEPVLRGPGGDRTEPCGPYDCPKSRRVEINFMLKELKPRRSLASDLESPEPAEPVRAPASEEIFMIYGPPVPPGWKFEEVQQ